MLSLAFVGCNKDKTGTLNLSITDAPIDSDGIVGVYITINEIQYHLGGGDWETFTDFVGPQTYNLLDLTHGESSLMGNLEMEAGTYTQLRFILNAPVYGGGTPSNPGCYLVFEDETTKPLFVPSSSVSGFKGVGAFKVPLNGSVGVTADFDIRKSVLETGSGMYILKPTIRLIVDNQAGKISGSVIHIPADTQIVIYAYEEGNYTETEANEPEPETPRFPNAVSSDLVDETGCFHIAFLAPMTYQLVVTANVDGNFSEVLGIVENVLVESKKTTSVTIDLDNL